MFASTCRCERKGGGVSGGGGGVERVVVEFGGGLEVGCGGLERGSGGGLGFFKVVGEYVDSTDSCGAREENKRDRRNFPVLDDARYLPRDLADEEIVVVVVDDAVADSGWPPTAKAGAFADSSWPPTAKAGADDVSKSMGCCGAMPYVCKRKDTTPDGGSGAR